MQQDSSPVIKYSNKGKGVPLHAMEVLGVRGGMNEMKYLFELSSFTSTSYCETAHHLTPVFFCVLSLPYVHFYFTFNES
jgi:hypothetical protein